MKKVLFATTALVASAGIASADVTLKGSAEMGIKGGDMLRAAPDDGVQFHTDIGVKFTLSGETDNGLTFGASIGLEDGGSANGSASIATDDGSDDYSVFISGGFGTLTMGDTDGAFDWALQDLDIIADIADANTSHAGFNGNSGLDGGYDSQVARYDYSFGDFAFAVSAELDDDSTAPQGDPIFGIGGKYSADLGGVTLGVGLGYQTMSDGATDADIIGVSLDAGFGNGLQAVVNYSQYDTTGTASDFDHMGVGLFYSMEALSLGVNYGSYDFGTGGNDVSGFGIAANYDLGGGAVVQFGYGSSDNGSLADTDGFSFGVAMSF